MSAHSITWTERPELFLGVPTVMLVARAHGRIIWSRYWPKLKSATADKARIVEVVERHFSDAPEHCDVETGQAFYEALEKGLEYELTIKSSKFSVLDVRRRP